LKKLILVTNQYNDEVYLKKLRDKAKNSWLNNINVDEYLKEVKGGYEDQ